MTLIVIKPNQCGTEPVSTDELDNYQLKIDNTLTTDSKSVAGAINELNSDLDTAQQDILDLQDNKIDKVLNADNKLSMFNTSGNLEASNINQDVDGNIIINGDLSANNFTGSSSGTNTGDETSQTIIDALGYTPVNPDTLANDYIPYTGAVEDVDLGTKTITAGSIVKTGATGDNLLMDDGNTTGFELSIVGGKTIVNAKVGQGSSYAIQTITNYDATCNVEFVGSVGTVQPILTLTSTGLYEITTKVYFNYRNVTIADENNILSFVPYRKNNTEVEISEAALGIYTGSKSSYTGSDMVELPPFMYDTAHTDDQIIIRAKNSTVYTTDGGLSDKFEITKVVFVATKISNNSLYTEKVTDITMFSSQQSSVSNIALQLKVNTGKTVYVDFGDGTVHSIIGNNTLVTKTSNYSANITYKIKIYGDLDGVTEFHTTSPRITIPSLEGFSKCTNLNIFNLNSSSSTIQSCNINYLSNTCTQIILNCISTPNGYVGDYDGKTAFPNLVKLYISSAVTTALYGNLTNLSSIVELNVYYNSFMSLDLTGWTNLSIFKMAGTGIKTGSLTGKTALQNFWCNSTNNTITGTIVAADPLVFFNYVNYGTSSNVNFNITGYNNLGFIVASSGSLLTGTYTPISPSYMELGTGCTFTWNLDNNTTTDKSNLVVISNQSNGACIISGDLRRYHAIEQLIPGNNDRYTRFTATDGFRDTTNNTANLGKLTRFALKGTDENGNPCNYTAAETNAFLKQLYDNRDLTAKNPANLRSINIAAAPAPDNSSGGIDGINYKTLLQAYRSPNNGSQYNVWIITTQ